MNEKEFIKTFLFFLLINFTLLHEIVGTLNETLLYCLKILLIILLENFQLLVLLLHNFFC